MTDTPYIPPFIHRHPVSVGARQWSLYARWTMREFNELEHHLNHRLDASHKAAKKYVMQVSQNKSLKKQTNNNLRMRACAGALVCGRVGMPPPFPSLLSPRFLRVALQRSGRESLSDPPIHNLKPHACSSPSPLLPFPSPSSPSSPFSLQTLHSFVFAFIACSSPRPCKPTWPNSCPSSRAPLRRRALRLG